MRSLVESRARYNLDDNERIAREGFRGPFNVWMYAPSMGMHAQILGEELRFEGTLSDRQREVAILRVAVHWKADFEWWAHARIAAGHGLEAEVIDAILSGEVPRFSDEAERLVYEFAGEVLREHQVNDTLYRNTAEALGEPAPGRAGNLARLLRDDLDDAQRLPGRAATG